MYNLLKSKRSELDRLTEALLEHETLEADEVRAVIKGQKISKKYCFIGDGRMALNFYRMLEAQSRPIHGFL